MPENERMGREPVQAPEIHQDFCELTYGQFDPQTSYGYLDEQPLTINDPHTFGDIDSTVAITELEGLAAFSTTGDSDTPALFVSESKPSECSGLLQELASAGELTIDFYTQIKETSGDTVQTNYFIIYDPVDDREVLRVFYQQSDGGGSTDNVINVRAQTDSGGLIGMPNASGSNGLPDKSEVVDSGFVRFTLAYKQVSTDDAEWDVYFNGNLVRHEETTPTHRLEDIQTTADEIRVAGSSPSFPSTTVAPAEMSRIRVYKRHLTSSEINAAFDPDDPDLLFNVFEDTDIFEDTRCNASKAVNFLRFSETFNSLGWPSSTSEREGIVEEFDGLNLYKLTVPDGETSLSEASEFSNFIINEGALATFTFVWKKTSFSATVRPGLSLEEFDGEMSIINTLDVSFESDTGDFISADVSTSKDVDYFSEDLGTHVRARLTIFGADSGAVSSDNQAVVRLQSASAGDSLLVGGLVLSNDDQDDSYSPTFGVQKQKTGNDKCFNTRSTCQDPDNYDKGVLPLKFVDKRSPSLTDDYYIPSLTGVKVTPAKLNPGGADRNARALGQRASISLSFIDHPHNDRAVDKYRADRSYNPIERGTFWTKWRARNPYYMQRPIKLRTGYLVDGAMVDEITRDFVITGFTGPDSRGRVTIQGKDILTLAEDDKAQAPVASQGKLSADLTAGATSATLEPAGIGDSEYPASGEIRIGKEVMDFTRSGDDLTLTRGQFGTEADEHDEGDTVQLCLRYVSEAPQDILFDLLTNYANIPEEFLDKDQWDAEALDFLPRLYSAIITEPNGVSKLISEMAQQMYFTIWWDERQGKVLLKAVRLAQDDQVFELDDDSHLIEDSISWRDLADELVTQVWVYYGQLDPTDKLEQGSNYAAVAITADPLAEGEDKHNLRRVKTVFSRWIDAGNAGAAEDLGERILNRYGNAPREVSFRVDAKDNYLWLGEFIRLTNRLRVDTFGLPTPVNLQIFEAEEASLGSEFRFVAQEFIPALTDGDDVEDPNIRTIPITSDFLNVNLRTLHDSQFGEPEGTETITFVIREGVTVGGYAAGGGVNVPYGQRDTSNDTYDGGTARVSGESIGTVPILQRASISEFRETAKDADYEGMGPAFYKIREYPISTALDTGDWPEGTTVNLVIEAGARLLGEGGNGSAHHVDAFDGSYTDTSVGDRPIDGVPGGDGGHALHVRYPIAITNGGAIGGGGGGGGSSALVQFEGSTTYRIDYTCGGGGSGFEPSDTKGTTTHTTAEPEVIVISSRDAAAGSATSGGSGGKHDAKLVGVNFVESRSIKTAGNGGGRAASGSVGRLSVDIIRFDPNPSKEGTYNYTVGDGGIPGKAIVAGADLITWINKGDVRGDEDV